LTNDTALDTALAAKAATNDLKQLHDNPHSTLPLHHVKEKSKCPKQKEDTSTAICYRCGGEHIASQCHLRDYMCHYCKKKGHLASVCRKKEAKDKGDTVSSKDQAQTKVVGRE
uniref:CCHC-type domain-containing protein n=1 Tax=Amphimedon queenslandica TaxID=400682 RepID=A0A1X7V2R2_AMPQE